LLGYEQKTSFEEAMHSTEAWLNYMGMIECQE